jgi:squalene-associated FAD-dependent desaturase
LLDRLDATENVHVQRALDIPVLAPDGRTARLRRTHGVPAPAHLTRALASYAVLSPADRLRAVRGALALRRLDPADRALDVRTLGAFLREHGQNDAVIDALWGIVATATLNLDPDAASLALAAKVFRTGLLDSAPAGDVGYATVPLGRIHEDAAAKALADAGVEVVLDAAVRRVGDGRVEVDGPDGRRTWTGSPVVLAVPPSDAFALAPGLRGARAAAAEQLGTSPIVNVHVVFDRRVTDLPFAAAVRSPVQWFFDRTHSSGVARSHPRAQYLAVTVSAAAAVIDRPAREVLADFVPALRALLPAATNAEVVDAFVTRERHATFRQAAGSWAMRPGAADGPDGVWLAGAWTDTGWPDTMESAVRSGVAAAEAAAGTPVPERTEFS